MQKPNIQCLITIFSYFKIVFVSNMSNINRSIIIFKLHCFLCKTLLNYWQRVVELKNFICQVVMFRKLRRWIPPKESSMCRTKIGQKSRQPVPRTPRSHRRMQQTKMSGMGSMGRMDFLLKDLFRRTTSTVQAMCRSDDRKDRQQTLSRKRRRKRNLQQSKLSLLDGMV